MKPKTPAPPTTAKTTRSRIKRIRRSPTFLEIIKI